LLVIVSSVFGLVRHYLRFSVAGLIVIVIGCANTTNQDAIGTADLLARDSVINESAHVVAHSSELLSGEQQRSNTNKVPGFQGNIEKELAQHKRINHRLASAEEDMYFVDRLLHTSSAAKKIQSSGRKDALVLYEKAQSFYLQATQARNNGDQQAQAQALSQAKLSLFAALRVLPKSPGHYQKQQDDCEGRVSTVNALLEANKRIRLEKSMAMAPDMEGRVNSELVKARQAYADKDYISALKIVDAVLGRVKQSLFDARNGDTLVRSLSFDSSQQAYQYEIGRNDTHKLLVKILLKDKLDNEDVLKRVNTNMAQAQLMRVQAEGLADQGDYPSAIKTLEQSTRQIVRAIRAAGVYIPKAFRI